MDAYTMPVRILCVDDERNVLRSLERIFLDDDYEIVLAGSGEEGLNVLKEAGNTFQVVISDYRMPVMNGVDFLKQVFALWPDTVRIVLSGYADAGAIVAAINEGHIYKFIPKPWNDDELRVTIQNCLERYFLLKRNQELLDELTEANQVLEEKVRQRTEDLELRNKALEFSQTMLGNLPVGVVGIDENGLIVHCNTIAAAIMAQACGDFFGADIQSCCDHRINSLVTRIRQEKSVVAHETFCDRTWHILGRTVMFCNSEAVVLVFLEV
ncbi:response regulator [Trichlorobacter ammonificans]|uniref:Response regulator receiver domain-containing protein n=1 Tax=Trichlorobacter ammonificans TaxID=2916410 RepID=A0ABN8HFM2_9BACT|nr:response regulator [Trichlorobacter ammonificans]CAH2031576.1 Response regulator receiver domain-containing protein [Trichlorobacter ammonificans]